MGKKSEKLKEKNVRKDKQSDSLLPAMRLRGRKRGPLTTMRRNCQRNIKNEERYKIIEQQFMGGTKKTKESRSAKKPGDLKGPLAELIVVIGMSGKLKKN